MAEAPCAKCGAAVAPRTYPGTPKLYCSDRCRWTSISGQERRRLKRYGLKVGDAAVMRLMQGNRCDICGEHLRHSEHVDHDHASGQVRALLCGTCNQGLGNFKDSYERLVAAAAYIKRWQ